MNEELTQLENRIKDLEDKMNLHKHLGTDFTQLLLTKSISNIETGSYTPTLTADTNITGSTAYPLQYARVNDIVIVSGRVDINAAGSGLTVLEISLPVASDFGAEDDCGGVYNETASAAVHGVVVADATSNRIQIQIYRAAGGTQAGYLIAMYQII